MAAWIHYLIFFTFKLSNDPSSPAPSMQLTLAVLKFPRKTLITGFNNLDMKVAIERDHVDTLAHALIISLMGSKVIFKNFVVALQIEYYP